MQPGNLRDLGGIRTVDGRAVRHQTLFRSEALTTLDAESQARLAAVPVQLLFDLRSTQEGPRQDELWAEGSKPEMVHVAVFPLARVNNQANIGAMLADHTGDAGRDYMIGIYRDLVDVLPERCLAEFAHRVGDRRQVPVVVHCTAGQDRTGMLIALVLLALGVPREAVAADYERSLDHFGPERMIQWAQSVLGPGRLPEAAATAVESMGAHRRYLDLALDLIIERHGSFEAYWAAAGVDAAALGRLRDVLLES